MPYYCAPMVADIKRNRLPSPILSHPRFEISLLSPSRRCSEYVKVNICLCLKLVPLSLCKSPDNPRFSSVCWERKITLE